MKQPKQLLKEFKEKYKPYMEYINKNQTDWKLSIKGCCKLAEECKSVLMDSGLPYPINHSERKRVEIQIERLNNA